MFSSAAFMVTWYQISMLGTSTSDDEKTRQHRAVLLVPSTTDLDCLAETRQNLGQTTDQWEWEEGGRKGAAPNRNFTSSCFNTCATACLIISANKQHAALISKYKKSQKAVTLPCVHNSSKNIWMVQIPFFHCVVWKSAPNWAFEVLDLLQSLNLQSFCKHVQ